MTSRTKRIFFYIILALSCYALAAVVGTGTAFFLLLLAGGVGELFFWGELFWGKKSG